MGERFFCLQECPRGKETRDTPVDKRSANNDESEVQQIFYVEDTESDYIEEISVCSVAEAAEILKVSKSTVYNMINRGEIYAEKRGNKYEVSIPSIKAYINACIEERNAAEERVIFTLVACIIVILLMIFALLKIY